MAVFTNLTKNRLSWPAPATVTATTSYYLEIGGNFLLSIGSGFNLVIQTGGRTDTIWTKRNKYS